MKIRLNHGLAYVEVVLTFRGRSLCLGDTILDTGSATTIFSADRLLEIGVVPEPLDALHRIRGVGGTEYAFTKRLDLLVVGDMKVSDFGIEVGAMDYGFPADGIPRFGLPAADRCSHRPPAPRPSPIWPLAADLVRDSNRWQMRISSGSGSL